MRTNKKPKNMRAHKQNNINGESLPIIDVCLPIDKYLLLRWPDRSKNSKGAK